MVNDAYGKKHTFNVPDDFKGSLARKKKAFKYALLSVLFIYAFGMLCMFWGWFLAKH